MRLICCDCSSRLEYCVHLPRLRINLLEFQLMGHYNFARTIEDQKSGARGTLVDCSNKGRGRGTVHNWRCALSCRALSQVKLLHELIWDTFE